MTSLRLLGGFKNKDCTNWGIHFLIFLSKYKPSLQSCNQGRKYSLPGLMILFFLKEMHMDKSEYNYSRGVGITKAVCDSHSFTIQFHYSIFQFHYSIFSLYFWKCVKIFYKQLGKQQGHWCLWKKKNSEYHSQKDEWLLRWINVFLMSEIKGFHKLFSLFFCLYPYYSPFW